MELEDIRKKYQCDEGRTFAQWKEWVRKNKPSQAQAHIVKAVAPNGSKYERVIGGYTDAQNTAFDLVSHGYKDVKLYHSVNAGPLKLLRNFSAPLHGAKFKDSADSVDEICQKYANDVSLSQKKDQPVKVTNISIKPSPVGGFEGNVYYSKNGETDLYSPWHIMANGKWGFPFGRSSTRLTQSDKKLIEQKIKKLVSQKGVKVKDSVDAVDSIREKYANDVYSPILGKEFSGKGKDFDKALKDKRYEGLYKQIDFYLKHYAKQKKLSDVQMKDLKRLVNEIRSYGKNGERWVTEVKKTVKEFKDSYEDIENIRNKYQKDAVGAGVVNPNFKFQTNVEKRLATTRKGRAMTLPQYGKPSKVIVKKDGNSFSVIGKDGQKLNKNTFKSYEDAEKWARGNGWMVEKRYL